MKNGIDFCFRNCFFVRHNKKRNMLSAIRKAVIQNVQNDSAHIRYPAVLIEDVSVEIVFNILFLKANNFANEIPKCDLKRNH